MKRLFSVTAALIAATCASPLSAGEPIPDNFFYAGGHASRYQLGPDARGDDFAEDPTLPGLQAGYRFPGAISLQGWWERNDARAEGRGPSVDLNLLMLSLRGHLDRQVLGVEPYAGFGAGELEFIVGNEENDESFMSLEFGIQSRVRPHWILDLGIRAPYSTDNERWDTEYYLAINHAFGVATPAVDEEEPELIAPQPTLRDSDRDGVPDTVDECPGTPRGSRVDNTGCPPDSNPESQ